MGLSADAAVSARSPRWPLVRWCFLALAIALAMGRRLLSPPESNDILYYVGAAQSVLWKGRPGWAVATASNLSIPTFQPLFFWPLGYPMVLSTALRFVPDPWLASLWLDIVFIIACATAWFVITESVELPVKVRASLWLVWAVIASPFRAGGPADWQAAALLFWAVALCVRGVVSERPFPIKAAAAGGLVGAAAVTRYAYWPLVPVLPAALVWLSLRGSRGFWKEAGLALALGALGLVFIAGWNLETSGHLTYLKAYYGLPGLHGFYPHYLLRTHPFPATFAALDSVCRLQSGVMTADQMVALQGISVPLFLWYARVAARAVRLPLFETGAGMATRFLHMAGALISGAVLVTLVTSTLRFNIGANGRPAVEVARYYLPMAPFVGLAWATSLVVWWSAPSTGLWARRLCAAVLVSWALLAMEGERRVWTWSAHAGTFRRDHQHIARAERFAERVRAQTQGSVAVLMKQGAFDLYGCAIATGIPIAVMGQRFTTLAPVTLIVGVRPGRRVRAPEETFAMEHGQKWGVSEFDGVELWAVTVGPGLYEF